MLTPDEERDIAEAFQAGAKIRTLCHCHSRQTIVDVLTRAGLIKGAVDGRRFNTGQSKYNIAPEVVAEWCRLLAAGLSYHQLGKQFKVPYQLVRDRCAKAGHFSQHESLPGMPNRTTTCSAPPCCGGYCGHCTLCPTCDDWRCTTCAMRAICCCWRPHDETWHAAFNEWQTGRDKREAQAERLEKQEAVLGMAAATFKVSVMGHHSKVWRIA